MLGEIVCPIGLTFTPVDFELALPNPIADPVKPHINSLRAFLLDCVSGDATGCIVVRCHRRSGLGMPHFLEGNAQGARLFAIMEEGTKLGFCRTRKYLAHYVAEDMHGAVGFERSGGGDSGICKEKITGGTRTCFDDREI